MSGQTVLPPNQIRTAYEDILEALRATAEDANLTLSLPNRPLRSSFVAIDAASAVYTGCFYLKGWPSRRLSGKKRLDIVCKAIETFSRPSWLLARSTVYVNYFVVSDSVARLAQSLHYDFVEGGQADHPFFHVQLTNEAIPADDLQSAGFALELPGEENTNECWVTTRIATPDMTLASVIYCLVADHVGAKRFAEFSETVQSIQNRLPPPNYDVIKKSLEKSPTHFKSSHWFAHMPGHGE